VWTLSYTAQAAVAASDVPPVAARVETTQDQQESVCIYRTREQQREGGLKRELTPWLTVSGLMEGEVLYEDFDARNGKADDTGRDDSASLQLGLIADLLAFASAEAIFEYDTDKDKVQADEAFFIVRT
jgi:hypothetical protein